MPVESARINAMPIMPIEPAKEVKKVLPFFVERLFKLSESAVKKDMEVRFFFCFLSKVLPAPRSFSFVKVRSSLLTGFVSLEICPS